MVIAEGMRYLPKAVLKTVAYLLVTCFYRRIKKIN